MIDKIWEISRKIKEQQNIVSPQLIVDNIYIGDYGDSKDLNKLKELKISHILICGKGLKKFFPEDFIYRQILIDDIENEDISQFFEESFNFVESALESKGVLLFHW